MLVALVVVGGAAALALALDGDGGGGEAGPPQGAGATMQLVSRLATRIAELETRVIEYCEKRAGGGTSDIEDAVAASDANELIELANRRPDERLSSESRQTVRDALADVSVVLRTDCPDAPFRPQVDRALRRLD